MTLHKNSLTTWNPLLLHRHCK